MFILVMNAVHAQPAQEQSTPQKDLKAVNLKHIYKPRTISLWDSGNGFICKYVVEGVYYMTRYDKQGNYVETLMQKEWSDGDSTTIHFAFQQSQYKSQRVTSFWEVSDLNKTGYYLEMTDSLNNISCMWVNEQGKFSIKPLSKKPDQTPTKTN